MEGVNEIIAEELLSYIDERIHDFIHVHAGTAGWKETQENLDVKREQMFNILIREGGPD